MEFCVLRLHLAESPGASLLYWAVGLGL